MKIKPEDTQGRAAIAQATINRTPATPSSDTIALLSAQRPTPSIIAAHVSSARAHVDATEPHAAAPRFEISINYSRAALRGGWWAAEDHTNGQDLWLNIIDSFPTRRRDERGGLIFELDIIEASQLLDDARALANWSDDPEACPLVVTCLDDGSRAPTSPEQLARVEATWASHGGDAEEIAPPRTLCDGVEPPLYEGGALAVVVFMACVKLGSRDGSPSARRCRIFAHNPTTSEDLAAQRLTLSAVGLLPMRGGDAERMATAFDRAARLEQAFGAALFGADDADGADVDLFDGIL